MSKNHTISLRFLLADDHLIVRQGIQFIVEELVEDSVFFHVSTLNQLIEQLRKTEVDILVLDAQFPDGVSLSVISEIKKIQPKIKILVFTSFEEEHFSLRFIEAGADGFLSKLSEEGEIKKAISEIVENGKFYPPLTQKLVEISKYSPHLLNPLSQLSERELQIADLYTKGYGNLEIANQLELKQNTISTFKKRIFEKLHIENLLDLVELMKIHHTD